MPRKKLVIFDFDGTLSDSFPWFLRVVDEVAADYGFRGLQDGEVEKYRRYSARQLVRESGLPSWKLARIAADVRRRMARDIETIELFPGVGALLENLAAEGVQLALATSNAEENVRQILGPDKAALFAFFGCGASIFGKRSKIRGALRRLKIPAGEALYVGDEIRDVEAARSAGVTAGVVTWGYNAAEVLRNSHPDVLFNQPGEIAEWLAGADTVGV